MVACLFCAHAKFDNKYGLMVFLGLLWTECEKDLSFVSDCDAGVWFVDMDIHSLVPPCFEPSVMATAPLSGDHHGTNIESIFGGTEAPMSVLGRLKSCVSFWENTLEASDFVLGIIKDGYRLPFIRLPPPVCMRNHWSILESMDFVSSSENLYRPAVWLRLVRSCPLVCSD